ncbi:NfeD family protein [Bacillus smithii]|uniref:NfeD family protein n=1 Tax=Bacillus smithii TaxID=1479 RepID=UPI003D20E7DE
MAFEKEKGMTNEVHESFAVKWSRILTHPAMVTILLSIASLAFVMELFTPRFGIVGIIGILALAFFFWAHITAGTAGYEAVAFFLVGVVLLTAELFLPGGIAGILGLSAMIVSILTVGDNRLWMEISLLIAIGVAVTGMIVMRRVFHQKMKLFQRMVLTDSTDSEKGYVSHVNRYDLIGKTGVSVTPLRPSGTILIDEERIDAITEGNYIAKDKKIQVVKVEGVRIIVREVKQ